MYGFVLVLDCTIHFIYVLNNERAKRARKKIVLIAKDTIIMFCHIKMQDDVHPQKRLSL